MILDRLIFECDKALRNIFIKPSSLREHPDKNISEQIDLSASDKKLSARLMRINHCGEVCAQALYHGQSIFAKQQQNKEALEKASQEESDHLAWTASRISELGGRVSLLNPLFYCSSFAIGAFAALIDDKWSLGFLEETEKQVEQHLNNHLSLLPKSDSKSFAILQQMRVDEIGHAEMALEKGAAKLPVVVKSGMKLMSKIMTKTTYYI